MSWEYLSIMVSWSTRDPGIVNCDYAVVNHKRSELVPGQLLNYKDPSDCFAKIRLLEIGEESVTVEYNERTIVVEKGNWRKISEAGKDYCYFDLEIDLRTAPLERF